MSKVFSSPQEEAMVNALRREIYAGVAMHAICMTSTTPMSGDEIAARAVRVADAMVKVLGPLGPRE